IKMKFINLNIFSSYAAYAVLFLAGLVLAVGVVGNMAVMCIVWNNYYMRSAWNYLLASMAFWDFLVLVLCLPVVVVNQLSHRRILGDITCRMVPYMEVVSLGITSFTLCALGIDRFHAATSSSQPKARRVERCRSVLLKLLLVWLAALLLSSPEIFLWQLSQAVSRSSGRSVSLHIMVFGSYFCLPILFTILCQMATRNVNSDYSSAKKQRDHEDRSSNQKRQQHQAVERQLNCTLLALAVVYGICALPEHVCNITLAYTHITISDDTAAMLALLHHFLLFFKSSVTPVLLLCLSCFRTLPRGTRPSSSLLSCLSSVMEKTTDAELTEDPGCPLFVAPKTYDAMLKFKCVVWRSGGLS
uniref:G-protein coupled receptors family 1 profile domain-containing protein n=1 Tax=Scophthalmus maximus TaxID=52904 RepID=A0A8D3DCX4_SCOMX